MLRNQLLQARLWKPAFLKRKAGFFSEPGMGVIYRVKVPNGEGSSNR